MDFDNQIHIVTFVLTAAAIMLLPLSTGKECEEYYKKLGNNHTMCMYQETNCKLLDSGITLEDRKKIVEIHNKYRNEDGALPVEWDEQLESVAQTWANQCKFRHDENRMIYRFDEPFYVGQNIAIGFNSVETPPDYADFIRGWHKEKKDHAQGGLHYKQLVAPLTDKMGCGMSHYNENDMFTYLFVCNYNPGAGDEMAKKFVKFFHMNIKKPDVPKTPTRPFLPLLSSLFGSSQRQSISIDNGQQHDVQQQYQSGGQQDGVQVQQQYQSGGQEGAAQVQQQYQSGGQQDGVQVQQQYQSGGQQGAAQVQQQYQSGEQQGAAHVQQQYQSDGQQGAAQVQKQYESGGQRDRVHQQYESSDSNGGQYHYNSFHSILPLQLFGPPQPFEPLPIIQPHRSYQPPPPIEIPERPITGQKVFETESHYERIPLGSLVSETLNNPVEFLQPVIANTLNYPVKFLKNALGQPIRLIGDLLS